MLFKRAQSDSEQTIKAVTELQNASEAALNVFEQTVAALESINTRLLTEQIHCDGMIADLEANRTTITQTIEHNAHVASKIKHLIND